MPKKRLGAAAIIVAAVVAGGVAGVVVGSPMGLFAQTNDPASTVADATGLSGVADQVTGAVDKAADAVGQTTDTTRTPAEAAAHGPHTNGSCTEAVLTGDNASKARAAAEKAVPNGTIQRLETDCDGAAYEAHMTKSDGSQVTVRMDKDFKVTSVEKGFGGGGPRHSDQRVPGSTAGA